MLHRILWYLFLDSTLVHTIHNCDFNTFIFNCVTDSYDIHLNYIVPASFDSLQVQQPVLVNEWFACYISGDLNSACVWDHVCKTLNCHSVCMSMLRLFHRGLRSIKQLSSDTKSIKLIYSRKVIPSWVNVHGVDLDLWLSDDSSLNEIQRSGCFSIWPCCCFVSLLRGPKIDELHVFVAYLIRLPFVLSLHYTYVMRSSTHCLNQLMANECTGFKI